MLEDLQKSLQETQNFLTQTVEKVSKSTQDPIEAGKNSLNQGFKTLTETGNSAINKITGVAEQAKDALTKVTARVKKVALIDNFIVLGGD